MIRRALLLSALSLVACSGTTLPPKPADPPSSPKPTTPAAKAPVESAPSGASSPKGAPASDEAPFHGEDPGKLTKLSGPKAWVLTDGGIGLYDLVKLEGTKAVFKAFGGEGEFKAPQAFTFPAPTGQKLKKGATVLFTVVTAVECARVVDVHDDSAKVAFVWGSKVSTRDATMNELLALDGTLGYGAPILFRQSDDEDWQDSMLAYQDGKTAWLVNGEKVPLKNVRPMDVAKARKPGENVLAREASSSGMAPAKIKKVLDDGLRYEVEFEEKRTGTAELCSVASIPK